MKRQKKILKNNSLPLITVITIALITSIYGLTKLFRQDTTSIYAIIEISQGLWWANTSKPEAWFIDSLKSGDTETNIVGKPIVELLDYNYYRTVNPNTDKLEYEIFMKVKLEASSSRSGETLFKRQKIGVGSPINIVFPSTLLSGTIVNLSKEPIEPTLVKKTVYLTNQGGDNFPWELEAIMIGDTYFDGINEVFKVVEKELKYSPLIVSDFYGSINSKYSENARYLFVKAEMLLQEKDGKYFLGEIQEISPGLIFNLATNNYNYSNLIISKVE